ncbi:MAG: AAA family ATPase, partial [Thermoanaerobaculia bacterium]
SGGEAQRVAIARTLAMEPPLLLMDEPTASLDPARRNELGRALVKLVKEEGRTLVLATHDDDLVRDFATRVVILAEGAVVEEGPPAKVLTDPQHPATRFLLQTKERVAPAPPPRPRAPRLRGKAPAP